MVLAYPKTQLNYADPASLPAISKGLTPQRSHQCNLFSWGSQTKSNHGHYEDIDILLLWQIIVESIGGKTHEKQRIWDLTLADEMQQCGDEARKDALARLNRTGTPPDGPDDKREAVLQVF